MTKPGIPPMRPSAPLIRRVPTDVTLLRFARFLSLAASAEASRLSARAWASAFFAATSPACARSSAVLALTFSVAVPLARAVVSLVWAAVTFASAAATFSC